MREAFIRAIREEPDNPLHYLVYSDWLEEQGDPLAEAARYLGDKNYFASSNAWEGWARLLTRGQEIYLVSEVICRLLKEIRFSTPVLLLKRLNIKGKSSTWLRRAMF